MEFSEFFRILHKNIDSYTLYDLAAEVFSVANNTVALTTDTTSNWFKGTNRSYRKQLRDKRGVKPFNEKDFINFLRNHNNKNWTDLQDSFKNECSKNLVINCITPDENVFLQSVMNQFKEVIGYPYERSAILAEYDDGGNNINGRIPITGTPSEQMLKTFKYTLYDYDLIYLLNINPSATQEAIDFLQSIESDIMNNDNFYPYRHDEMYKNIIAFAYTVDHYNRTLSTREHSVVSMYTVIDIEIRALWKDIVTLYSKICGFNTLFADRPPIGAHSM